MKSLLVTGPDSTLRDVYALAQQAYASRNTAMHALPSKDYYKFDLDGLAEFPPGEWEICIAVNEFYINDVRRALHAVTEVMGYESTSVISPHAHVDATASIGKNAIVFGGCSVSAGVHIGHHTVLRPNVVLSEDVRIGSYVTLEANVSIREGTKVGDFTTICANSSVARMTEIGEHCYLNLVRQYSGRIPACTFYSAAFENPLRAFTKYR